MSKPRMRQDRQRALRDLSDSALIDAMRAGVSEAWQEFLVRFRPLLIQYGLRTKMDRSDAHDCVEHVLEDAAMRWAVEGAAAPKNVVAYLLRASSLHRRTLERDATRRVRKHQRATDDEQREGAILSSCSEAAIRDSRGPAEHVEEFTQEALARLYQLVQQSLGEDDSKILAQLADGLPHREIAAELGLSYEAGRKRIQRLCARVRDLVPIAVQRLSSTESRSRRAVAPTLSRPHLARNGRCRLIGLYIKQRSPPKGANPGSISSIRSCSPS